METSQDLTIVYTPMISVDLVVLMAEVVCRR